MSPPPTVARAQQVERTAFKRAVVGSIPTGGALFNKEILAGVTAVSAVDLESGAGAAHWQRSDQVLGPCLGPHRDAAGSVGSATGATTLILEVTVPRP